MSSSKAHTLPCLYYKNILDQGPAASRQQVLDHTFYSATCLSTCLYIQTKVTLYFFFLLFDGAYLKLDSPLHLKLKQNNTEC